MTKARLTVAEASVPLGLAKATFALILSNCVCFITITARGIPPLAAVFSFPSANVSYVIAENWAVPIVDIARHNLLGHRPRVFLGWFTGKRAGCEVLSGFRDNLMRSFMSIRQPTAEANEVANVVGSRQCAGVWSFVFDQYLTLGRGPHHPMAKDETETKTLNKHIGNRTQWWLLQGACQS